jgi:hypothetical protein
MAAKDLIREAEPKITIWDYCWTFQAFLRKLNIFNAKNTFIGKAGYFL